MDSMSAFLRGDAARRSGAKLMVFDWDKAAKLIAERAPAEAGAGLRGDWEWTGGTIWRDGAPVFDEYTYLASLWATPELSLDGEVVECWRYAEDSPGWDSDTKWPGVERPAGSE